MRKLCAILLSALLFLLTSCSISIGSPSISEPAAAKYIDKKTSKPTEAAAKFKQNDSVIYFTVKIDNFPKDTKLKAVWKYLGDGTELPSEITTGGTGYEAFTLNKNTGPFPAGQYEVTVSAEINGKTVQTKGGFEVLPEVTPTHILNPVTCKSIDSEEKLNPADVTSEFSTSDQVIYFIVQCKDIPKDTKISCEWYYADTDDIVAHDIVTDGTRNIAFNLTPQGGQKFPPGKYVVTASVTINNQIESVTKEFEVK